MKNSRVIGIDPGSHFTGYGILQDHQGKQNIIDYGRIQTLGDNTAQRLFHIYSELREIIISHEVQELAIESVFFHKNAQSALKIGQARGAALVAAASYGLPVAEYAPKTIKKAAVGYGSANKNQIQKMIKMLLNLKELPEADAADALAVAICHCQTRQLTSRIIMLEKS